MQTPPLIRHSIIKYMLESIKSCITQVTSSELRPGHLGPAVGLSLVDLQLTLRHHTSKCFEHIGEKHQRLHNEMIVAKGFIDYTNG